MLEQLIEAEQAVTASDQMKAREAIFNLEGAMKEMPQAQIQDKHYFSKGLYAREIFIPKGTLLTGKIHKFENLNIISQGDISILTEDGVRRFKAPFTIVSRAGTKRVGYTHEDTVWTTIHATEETDLEKIEDEVIAKDFDQVQITEKEFQSLKEAKCPGL